MTRKSFQELAAATTKDTTSLEDRLSRFRNEAVTKRSLHAFIQEFSPLLTGEEGALSGLLFSVKDNFLVRGYPVRSGIAKPIVEKADETATVVASLLDNGATLVGSTNMDPLALGATGANPFFGAVSNPVKIGCPIFGSSSGAAATVGSNLVDFAVGSDSGGSIRAPAAACNLVGYKSSPAFLPKENTLLLHSPLDCVGFITPSVNDLAFLLGRDDFSEESSFVIPSDLEEKEIDSLKPILSFLQLASATVRQLPKSLLFSRAYSARKTLMAQAFKEFIEKWRIEGSFIPDEGKALLKLLSKGHDPDHAMKEAEHLKKHYASLLEPSELLLLPVFPAASAAFSLYLSFANICELPAVTLSFQGRPFQVVGSSNSDRKLISRLQKIFSPAYPQGVAGIRP